MSNAQIQQILNEVRSLNTSASPLIASYVAQSPIVAKDVVSFAPDGKVTKPLFNAVSKVYTEIKDIIEIAENKFLVAGVKDLSVTKDLYAVIASWNGTTMSFGTEVLVNSNAALGEVSLVKMANNAAIITFASNYTIACGITVSGTTITKGNNMTLSTFNASAIPGLAIASLSSTTAIATYITSETQKYAIIINMSGVALSKGVATDVASGYSSNVKTFLVALSANTALFLFLNTVNSTEIRGRVLTISGTTITVNSAISTISLAGEAPIPTLAYKLSSSSVLLIYEYLGNYQGEILTVSGINISNGGATTIAPLPAINNANNISQRLSVYSSTYYFLIDRSANSGRVATFTISGNSITPGRSDLYINTGISLYGNFNILNYFKTLDGIKFIVFDNSGSYCISPVLSAVGSAVREKMNIGIALANASAGQTVDILLSGVYNEFSGLVPSTIYRGVFDDDYAINVVGYAISPTSILAVPYWERNLFENINQFIRKQQQISIVQSDNVKYYDPTSIQSDWIRPNKSSSDFHQVMIYNKIGSAKVKFNVTFTGSSVSGINCSMRINGVPGFGTQTLTDDNHLYEFSAIIPIGESVVSISPNVVNIDNNDDSTRVTISNFRICYDEVENIVEGFLKVS